MSAQVQDSVYYLLIIIWETMHLKKCRSLLKVMCRLLKSMTINLKWFIIKHTHYKFKLRILIKIQLNLEYDI